ncbi:YdaS family helix-turn-helix protein [Nitrosomonas marina]|uniref:DNA-binding transcriptional regulator YdaS, prophage-encoded, Cro superfamily n=1 Tax=Nitrosomonas marina TaxID=917 RepID=A0A1H8IY37_9PROT|nr:YdaS family helix-turn-helix protein [Nitrosomonas marina]SEN73085.1 DNA-binding transcriptional regulator YdaS, prophage-encoded, Cro superfamily [Nitrosomonas marina]
MSKYPLQKAIEVAGGQSELAKKINCWFADKRLGKKNLKQQHVYKWINHPSGVPTVPPEYRLAIEEITNRVVTVRSLSHDIYPQEIERNENAA